MPVHFDQMNAKISNYQDNGPLNALVHVIINRMAVMPDDPMGDGTNIKAELLAKFEEEWDTSLYQDPWNRLHAILVGTTDSMHKEILLGPVLRRMLATDENQTLLSDQSVAKLAKRFGIRAEFYLENSQEDTLEEGDDKLKADNPKHLATLRVCRKGSEYRFGASNHLDPNVSSIDTASHNYNSYRSNPAYEETAPRLKPLLQSAVHKTISDRPEGSPVDVGRLADNVSKIFVKGDETAKARADQKGSTADDFMGGLLSGVDTFFGGGVFDSLNGIVQIFKSLFGSVMEIILGFQEKIMERDKQPGDPLTKQEREANPALRKAANSFSIWVKSLGEAIAAQHLNEAWRADPDSTEAWVGLVKALVEDEQLSEADTCLRAQEERLLESMEALKKEAQAAGQDEHVKIIEARIKRYHSAIDPLEANTRVGEDKEGLEARLGLFKETNLKMQAFAKTHQALKDAQQKAQALAAEQGVLKAEQQAAGAATFGFQERLARLHTEFETNGNKIHKLLKSENNMLKKPTATDGVVLQFMRCMELTQKRAAAAQAQQQTRGRSQSAPPTRTRTS